MFSNFDASLKAILAAEGGNDDDPADRGGRTSRGITQREYDAWCRLHHTVPMDVWKISDDTVKAIYFSQYWSPWGDRLPTPIDYLFFDCCVNHGYHQAAKILQRALGVTADGWVGLITYNAAAQVKDIKAFIDRFVAEHKRVYDAIVKAHPSDIKFRRGWMNRADQERLTANVMLRTEAARKTALAMIGVDHAGA